MEDGLPAIVSEWVEGGTLDDYIKEHPECNKIAIVSKQPVCATLGPV